MAKFRTDTAYEIDGVFFVEAEIEGRPLTISVRAQDTTGTPLSDTEIAALQALKEAEQAGGLTRKAMRDLGRVRRQEDEARAAAEVAAVAAGLEAEEAKRPKVPGVPDLVARIAALEARVAALEPASPPGKKP